MRTARRISNPQMTGARRLRKYRSVAHPPNRAPTIPPAGRTAYLIAVFSTLPFCTSWRWARPQSWKKYRHASSRNRVTASTHRAGLVSVMRRLSISRLFRGGGRTPPPSPTAVLGLLGRLPQEQEHVNAGKSEQNGRDVKGAAPAEPVHRRPGDEVRDTGHELVTRADDADGPAAAGRLEPVRRHPDARRPAQRLEVAVAGPDKDQEVKSFGEPEDHVQRG